MSSSLNSSRTSPSPYITDFTFTLSLSLSLPPFLHYFLPPSFFLIQKKTTKVKTFSTLNV